MKKFLILFLIIPLFSMATENVELKLIGKWTAKKDGYIIKLNFDAEGFVYFEFDGTVQGGREFVAVDGEKCSLTYEIINVTSPIHVDLIVTKLESEEVKRGLCIAEFISKDSLNFMFGVQEGIRPTEFDTENSIILTREKY